MNIEDFERVLTPDLVSTYEQQGYCYVVSGSTQRGRAEADPKQVPAGARVLPRVESRAQVAHEISPYSKGKGPVEVQLRLDVRLVPAGLQPPRAGDDDLPPDGRAVRDRGGLIAGR